VLPEPGELLGVEPAGVADQLRLGPLPDLTRDVVGQVADRGGDRRRLRQ